VPAYVIASDAISRFRSRGLAKKVADHAKPTVGTAPGLADSGGWVDQAACTAWLIVSYSMGVRRPSRCCRRRRW
jgi:hypothetical protein